MARRSRKKAVKATRPTRPLREGLEEAEQTLLAIRTGEVDAIVVGGPQGDRVFTLTGADHDYRVLMDEMSEGVATLGKDGIVSYCNLRFAGIVGLPAERVVGAPIQRIVPQEARDRLAALLQAGLLAVSKAEFQLPHPGGALASVLLSVSKVQMEGKVTLCVIATDVTEEKRREA